MTGLQLAWLLSLLVTLTALPVGLIRTLIYRSGEIDHTRTLGIAALVAVGIGLLGLLGLVVTSALLLFT